MKSRKIPASRKSRGCRLYGNVWRGRGVEPGQDQALPESRPDVLKSIQERLDNEGAFLQRYSNGEFISSSYAIGRTYEECSRVPVLETPGYTVHFDAANNLYWHRGGCSD
jgi:hypothetical protein